MLRRDKHIDLESRAQTASVMLATSCVNWATHGCVQIISCTIHRKGLQLRDLPLSQISWTPPGGASVQWAFADRPASRSSDRGQDPQHCSPTSSHRWSHYDLPCGNTHTHAKYEYAWLNPIRHLAQQIVAPICWERLLCDTRTETLSPLALCHWHDFIESL